LALYLIRNNKLRSLLSIFALFIFSLSAYFGYELLDSNKLSGTEFVSFIIAFAVISLIISFSSEVQEFSIAGSIVKLKEVKKDAEYSINELKSARVETFRFLLSLAKKFSGGWGDSDKIDERLPDFWLLYNQIVKFGCEKDLKKEIEDIVFVLLKGQLNSISYSSDDITEKYNSNKTIPTPDVLTIEALENTSVEKAAKRNVCGGSIEKIKSSLVAGLNEYKKLYVLHESIKKI